MDDTRTGGMVVVGAIPETRLAEANGLAVDTDVRVDARLVGTGVPEAYAAVPWFWSDRYDETLQVAGLTDEAVDTVERGLGEGRPFFGLAAAGRPPRLRRDGLRRPVRRPARGRTRPGAASRARPRREPAPFPDHGGAGARRPMAVIRRRDGGPARQDSRCWCRDRRPHDAVDRLYLVS